MNSQDALSPEDRATSDRLLTEIVENPHADGPRLVYADWLTERGDPRGAFIVDQCRLAQLDETDPEWCVLYARSERTLFQHRSQWTKAARELLQLPDEEDEEIEYFSDEAADPFEFRRGFIERVNLAIKDPKQLDALAKMTPLRCIGLAPGRKVREVAALHARLGLPGLQIRMYDWSPYEEAEEPYDEGGEDEEVEELDEVDEDEELEELEEDDEDGGEDEEELEAHPDEALNALEMLELVDLSKVEDLTINGYIQLSQMQRLTQLLEQAPLRSLVLSSCGITSGGATRLASGRFLDRLETLDLSNNDVGVQGFRKLLQARGKAPFSLSLGGNYKLRKHCHLAVDGRPLRALNLSGIATDELIERLGQKDASQTIRKLEIGPVTREQLLALARLPFGSLTRLDISGYIDGGINEGLAALYGAPQFGALVELLLYGAGVGDAGVAALVRSPHLTRLTRLDLTSCQITERGVAELVAWPGLQNLVELRLSDNRLGAKGLEALMKSKLDPVRLVLDAPRSNRMRHALYERFGEAVICW